MEAEAGAYTIRRGLGGPIQPLLRAQPRGRSDRRRADTEPTRKAFRRQWEGEPRTAHWCWKRERIRPGSAVCCRVWVMR